MDNFITINFNLLSGNSKEISIKNCNFIDYKKINAAFTDLFPEKKFMRNIFFQEKNNIKNCIKEDFYKELPDKNIKLKLYVIISEMIQLTADLCRYYLNDKTNELKICNFSALILKDKGELPVNLVFPNGIILHMVVFNYHYNIAIDEIISIVYECYGINIKIIRFHNIIFDKTGIMFNLCNPEEEIIFNNRFDNKEHYYSYVFEVIE